MAHLEARGIIHRDLASRNVLMSSTLTAKVADLGLARITEGSEGTGVYVMKGQNAVLPMLLNLWR